MLRDAGVEAVGREVIGRREQTEILARHDPMEVALFGANRAIALRGAREDAANLVGNATAVAPATIDSSIIGRRHDSPRENEECNCRSSLGQSTIEKVRAVARVWSYTFTDGRGSVRITIAQPASSSLHALQILVDVAIWIALELVARTRMVEQKDPQRGMSFDELPIIDQRGIFL